MIILFQEGHHGRLIILGRNFSKDTQHLRTGDLRDAVGWIHSRNDRESWMAGCNLGLGVFSAHPAANHRLGAFSTHHGWAMDLGIFLAGFPSPAGMGWNRVLDWARGVQLFQICQIGKLVRAELQYQA